MTMRQRSAFVLLLGITALLTYNAVTTDRFPWDLAITRWMQEFDAEKVFGPLAGYNNRLGNAGVAGAIGIAMMAWLWLKGRRAEAMLVGLVGVADLVNPLLREVIGRPRPSVDLVTVYRPQGDNSFPSGTAMHVMLFSGVLIFLARRLLAPGRWRTMLCVLLGLFVPLMGAWLIYRGVHWSSDVVGGYLFGIIFLWVIIRVYQRYVIWRRSYPSDYLPAEELPPLVRPFARLLVMVN